MPGESVCRQEGFAYLALLLMVAILGAGVAAVGPMWAAAQQRDRERDLLHVGEQFRRSITQYYESSPGDKRYPPRLEDLLQDPRYPGLRRYLRRIHFDPLTNRAQWGLVMAPTGGIMGVYSLSPEQPIKRDNFSLRQKHFAGKSSYAEWTFVHEPHAQAVPPPTAPPARSAKPGMPLQKQ